MLKPNLPWQGLSLAGAVLSSAIVAATAAHALSELPEEDVPPEAPITVVPLPPPLGMPSAQDDAPPQLDEPAELPAVAAPPPDVLHDESLLPEPVRNLRRAILEACEAGDIEALRPLLQGGERPTNLSFGDPVEDPIAFLKEISGDSEGHEILAILQEVLEAGFVRVEPDTDQELYIWPYFFAVPLAELTAPQRVELFRLVTAGDYEDMKTFGAYIFYRVGITPDGHWAFFVAGD